MTQPAAARIADLCVEIVTTPNGHLGPCGQARIADWFASYVGGGNQTQIDRIAMAKPAEPHRHERLPPTPRAAAARLVHIMLQDIGQRLDADTAPELLLPDLDAVRVMVAREGLHPDITTELNKLYAQCEPVPEPTFTSWNREYRANPGKPWELVTVYTSHAEAHRGLLKAQATCPGLHRIIGVVA